jgi:hypothetical protein
MRGRVFTWLDVVWNVMKVVSLGWGGWLAEQASVEMVYYLGGTMLVFAGLIGIVALRDERLAQADRWGPILGPINIKRPIATSHTLSDW